MSLERKYTDYKTWLVERHLDDGTWVLNRDVPHDRFADYGTGDSLYYTCLFLTALAVERNEPEFTARLTALNAASYAKGMYPRYRDRFDTSKDPYVMLFLALAYARDAFPDNTLVRNTLSAVTDGVREQGYQLKNPDGSATPHGQLDDLRPVMDALNGTITVAYYTTLFGAPVYSRVINTARRSYFNNLMLAGQYLVYHLCTRGGLARFTLSQSTRAFASVNSDNPFMLMLRDMIVGSRTHEVQIAAILERFPSDHLPSEWDHITNSDVLWQIDPRDWETPNQGNVHEYSGVDYLILYQFYKRHYRP